MKVIYLLKQTKIFPKRGYNSNVSLFLRNKSLTTAAIWTTQHSQKYICHRYGQGWSGCPTGVHEKNAVASLNPSVLFGDSYFFLFLPQVSSGEALPKMPCTSVKTGATV